MRKTPLLSLLLFAAACGGEAYDALSETDGDAITATAGGFAPSPGSLCDPTIDAHWQRHTYLGAAVSGDTILFDGGRSRDYAAGTIIWSPRSRCAYTVRFGFWQRWKSEGRVWSGFGYPVSDEEWDGHGSFQFFEGGSMWWTESGGVRALYGPMAVKHNEVRGLAGYPLSDAAWTSELGGMRVPLELGHVIYWTNATGAHAVRYGILNHYVSMGEQESTLGFPTSDEICPTTTCFTDFQGGRIVWNNGPSVVNTIEDVPVVRLQLEVENCNVQDAGTNDYIWVEMATAAGKRFFVDSENDDFERGNVRRYDLSPGKLGIGSVRDIQRITLGKINFDRSGKLTAAAALDAVCIQRVALYVNQAGATAGTVHLPIFNQTLVPAVWLDQSRPSFTIAGATMRAQRMFSTARVPSVKGLFNSFTFTELESIITGITGDALVGKSAHFGDLHGRAVEVTRIDSERVAVDLDLEGDSIDGPEVDVDFDIHFVCDAQGRLVFQVENQRVNVDPAWYQLFSQIGLLFTTPSLPALNSVTIGTPFCPVTRVFDGSPGTVVFTPN